VRPMAQARYALGVLILISVPISIGLWYAIHPFARAWRRVGPIWTYVILAVPACAVCALVWSNRDFLLGTDLGTQPLLIALAVPGLVAGGLLARARRRHLTQRVLTGVPELSSRDKGRLLTEGVYARVRNPRYLEFLLFVFAYVAFTNYLGAWVLFALSFPAIHLVVLLEERELRDRFGAEYEDYCRKVPRYIPRRLTS